MAAGPPRYELRAVGTPHAQSAWRYLKARPGKWSRRYSHDLRRRPPDILRRPPGISRQDTVGVGREDSADEPGVLYRYPSIFDPCIFFRARALTPRFGIRSETLAQPLL